MWVSSVTGIRSTAPAPGGGHGGFPIVGVGASAGGLEAFSHLLAHLSPTTGMGFVLVQHLDPKHESKLVELLAKPDRMPVVEATEGVAVQPNHVYIIPPNATLRIAAGVLHLTPRGESRIPHLPVDHFLKSLAEDRQTGAIGVILSGTGSDGTVGLEEIKATGGITFAQDDESAKYPGMPQSAVRSGCVDMVLSPEAIAAELTRLGQHPYLTPGTEAPPAAGAMEQDQFARVLHLLHATFRVDFAAYRDTTIKRRITRRMLLHSTDSLAEYAAHLEGDRVELDALYQDILINVTSFFREPETFELLKNRVFPAITQGKDANTPIRIWVSGCSTGQEAYSLAIALSEYLEDTPVRPPIQIFATDLNDTVALHTARDGLYPENIGAQVSPERLGRFFSREKGGYRVSKSLRDMVLFSKHNVAADPPFSRVDLISCRNLLIYLAEPLQRRVIPAFHYALNPVGFLVLGHAETVGAFADLFGVVDQPHRIYGKKTTATRQYPHFHTARGRSDSEPSAHGVAASPADWQREADRVALGHYVPPGVLVNQSLDILQFRGRTGPYLAPAPGEASLNVLRMAREGLFHPLRAALIQCGKEGVAVHTPGVHVRAEGIDREIDMSVLPIRLPHAGDHCYLVLFGETVGVPPSIPAPAEPAARGDASAPNLLRQELASTREYLQSLIEQQDATNEDLKSANEEILSSNEELQSTNEELETAQEELQSVNEELTTVNEQLQHRNLDLGRLNDDMTNLLGSSGVPMVVLGVDRCIRRLTPAAGRALDLQPGDVGRSIDTLRLPLEMPDLAERIVEVIETMQTLEREVRGKDGRWYALRIHPYRTTDNRIDGTVLVLADLHEAKAAQTVLRDSRDYAQAVIDTARTALLALDIDLRVHSANRAFYRTFNVAPRDTEGQLLYELGNRQWDIPALRTLLSAILQRNASFEDFEVRHDFASIGPKIMLLNARRIDLHGDAESQLILLSIEDCTERVHATEALNEADRRKNEFLATLAHELRNPLAPIRNALQIMQLGDGTGPARPAVAAMMERQVDQMVRLVDDLVDVSRISRGRIELRLARVDVATVVRQAADTAQPLFDSRQQKLQLTLPPHSVYLHADPTRLSQVLANLLSNAGKFTDERGLIGVILERDGNEAVLRVRDTGIGISAEQMPHVFDMFMQVDTSLERSIGGLGIGLTLVRSVVELHGGSVRIHSAGLGQGSEVTVRLPILVDVVDVASPASLPATPTALTAQRILVVDDNVDSATSLALLLELNGNETHTAHDGLAAVGAAETLRPDLVLLDIGLPKLNGYEVARRIRAQPWGRAMILVALTGWGQEEDRRRSTEAGFNAHLVKPVNYAALTRLLAEQRSATST